MTGAAAVSVGGKSACALLVDGTARCWGDNTYGQLGNGTTIGSPTPVMVSGLMGATAISIGGSADYITACALVSGGAVECWGGNGYGELGIATTTGPFNCSTVGTFSGWPCSTTPVAVVGLMEATAISVGGDSACALLSGGTVQCWGDNTVGELGNGTTTSSSTPVAVSGLTGATAVSVSSGSAFACALVSGGTVQCWGDDTHGELGDGTTTSSSTPVTVSGLTGATAISVGGDSTCALLSGSDVQCWGGSGASLLAAVTGLTGATAISVGGDSACALLSSGTVQCWGANNSDGQLGNGTTASSSTPVTVSRLTDATAVSVGSDSACALLSAATVQCWGGDGYGELGNGTLGGPDTCGAAGTSAVGCAKTPVQVE